MQTPIIMRILIIMPISLQILLSSSLSTVELSEFCVVFKLLVDVLIIIFQQMFIHILNIYRDFDSSILVLYYWLALSRDASWQILEIIFLYHPFTYQPEKKRLFLVYESVPHLLSRPNFPQIPFGRILYKSSFPGSGVNNLLGNWTTPVSPFVEVGHSIWETSKKIN